MRPLIYDQTRFSPRVVFDADNGVFEIEGVLMLEDNKVFFQTVNLWWRSYQQNPNPQTNVVCKLSYYTLATDNFLMAWFSVLKDTPNLELVWYYDPEDWDMEEYATSYKGHYNFIRLEHFN